MPRTSARGRKDYLLSQTSPRGKIPPGMKLTSSSSSFFSTFPPLEHRLEKTAKLSFYVAAHTHRHSERNSPSDVSHYFKSAATWRSSRFCDLRRTFWCKCGRRISQGCCRQKPFYCHFADSHQNRRARAMCSCVSSVSDAFPSKFRRVRGFAELHAIITG